MNNTTMQQEQHKEQPNAITDTNARKKELKKAALKKTATGFHRETSVKKYITPEDAALLKSMITEASTPEEAEEIFQKLGKDIMTRQEFDELIKKNAAGEAGGQETQSLIAQPEQTEEFGSAGRVKIGREEYPIETYEKAPEEAEIIALRKTLALEIDRLDKKFEILEELNAKAKKNRGNRNAAGIITAVLQEIIAEARNKKQFEGESVDETIEFMALGSENQIDPDIKKIYQAKDKLKAISECLDKIWRELLTLRQIDSGYDPLYELGRAYENGEISDADHARIVEGKERERLLSDETGPSALTGTTVNELAADDLASETPDLYGFMEKAIKEQAQERARLRTDKKKRRHSAPVDEAEFAARAKMRRMARMRQEGASDEEIKILETAEAKFEPTPEMVTLNEEITRAREIVEKWLREIQSLGLDEALREFESLNFAFRHLESLKMILRQIEAAARDEFENQKEMAKNILGRGSADSPKTVTWLHIKSSGQPEEKTFGEKLRKAVEKPIGIGIQEKKGVLSHKNLDTAFAEGKLSEEEYLRLRKTAL